MRVVATIEARMGATRLPGKMALELFPGLPALGAVIERVHRASGIDAVVVATSTEARDDALVALAARFGAHVYRGSETDVLGRVVDAGASVNADALVLVTGDCSCISPSVLTWGIAEFGAQGCDFLSNCLTDTFPPGIDVQVVRFAALQRASVLARAEPFCRNPANFEHVNFFIRHHPELFSIHRVVAPRHHHRPQLSLLLDTPADLIIMRTIYERLYPINPRFDLDDILALVDAHPDLVAFAQQQGVDRVGYVPTV